MKRVGLVTGGTDGIGKQTAIELNKYGFIVYAAGRNVRKIEDLKNIGIIPISIDVTNEQSMINCVSEVITKENWIDILVNCAGYGYYGAALQPTCPTQPDNVQVLWFYGLHSNEIGSYIKKPMNECNGEEILKEFLYYCGLEDKMDETISHSIAIPTVMPYITSQFMPRKINDRPQVILNGSTNLAFIG